MANKPEVLMFGWELPPNNSGGLGVACYGMAKGLSLQGIPVAFALPKRFSTHVPFMQILSHDLQGIEVFGINSLLHEYATEQSYKEFITQHNITAHYGNSLYDETLRYSELAAVWAKNHTHDLIHAHDWLTYSAGMKAKSVSGKPLIAHVHATEYDRTGGSVNGRIAEIEYEGLRVADKVITVSHYTKNIVNRYYNVPLEKIHVVHNGIDPITFEPQVIRQLFPNKKIVLFVGRLTFQKGVEYFLDAAKEVLKTDPETLFLIVGDGDLYQELVLKAASLNIAENVIFAGFLTGEKLQACYEMSDVFVMPSVSEPYGIVALEALASGTPTIISKQSGVSESIAHAMKIDFWDTRKMAYMISTLMRYPKLAKKLAQKAQSELQRQNWEQTAKKIITVYEQVM